MDAPLAMGFASKIDLGPTEGPARKPPMRLAACQASSPTTTSTRSAALGSARAAAAGARPGERRDVRHGLRVGRRRGVQLHGGNPAARRRALPAGHGAEELPAQSYLTFRLTVDGGPLHPQMQAAMREIWGERLPASGLVLAQVPDLEYYPRTSSPAAPARTVEFWIPSRAKQSHNWIVMIKNAIHRRHMS
jgi:hypothetical protein